jgi:hypothetical protein
MAGPAAGTNPIDVINDSPMGIRQWVVVILMVLLNALDGFDVLSSAFASPGISANGASNVPRSASSSRPSWWDGLRLGYPRRHGGQIRPQAHDAAVPRVMAAGMYLASVANAVTPMVAFRFLTGIGIGGMLAATNAVTPKAATASGGASPSAPMSRATRWVRSSAGIAASGDVWLTLTAMRHGWRAVFVFGAVVTARADPGDHAAGARNGRLPRAPRATLLGSTRRSARSASRRSRRCRR